MLKLLNTMRVTFYNSTSYVLTDINITGCQNKHIDKLDPGGGRTIWISIPGDCEISIDYLEKNIRMKEYGIGGYITNDNGQIIDYNIGGKNDQLLP
jgi:hypothetical protein